MRRNKPVILKRSDHRLDLGPAGYNLFVSRDKQQEERSARRLRAWMRAVISLVVAGGAVVAGLFVWSYLVPYFHEELQIGAASGLESEPASSEVSALPVYDEMGLPVYGNEVNLFVINPEEPAQEDFAPQLGAAAGVQVDSHIVAAVELMVAAAKEDGLALTFTEGYVSYQEQGERFEEKVDQLMEEGLTAVMARTEAQSLVPEAGESDSRPACACVSPSPGTRRASRSPRPTPGCGTTWASTGSSSATPRERRATPAAPPTPGSSAMWAAPPRPPCSSAPCVWRSTSTTWPARGDRPPETPPAQERENGEKMRHLHFPPGCGIISSTRVYDYTGTRKR